MTVFAYEEQGDKKYLVYEKKPEDSLDNLTLEMISNNKIKGLASANHIQIDDHFYMKYDISGCQSLREYLRKTVNKRQLLEIIESIADTAMEAEDYMLRLSSYVLDADHMYIDKTAGKLFIVVLPIVREEVPLEKFLKELLMGAQYDQTEDCGYVAALINFFSSSDFFSACALKELTVSLKKEKFAQKSTDNRKAEAKTSEKAFEKRPVPEVKRQSHEKQKINPLSKASDNPEKQNCLDILFSEEEEKTLKEKIGMFFKREKSEKKREKSSDSDSELSGIAIPGMELSFGQQKEKLFEEPVKEVTIEKYKKPEVPIPAQKVELKRMPAEKHDFGETVYMLEGEDDETEFLGQRESGGFQFTLCRFSTGESFQISGDVVRIGRSPSIAEICITGNKCVGRIHAILYIHDGKVFIEDNHSKNYTFVDGIRLNPEDPPVQLENGSKIQLGDEALEFRVEG